MPSNSAWPAHVLVQRICEEVVDVQDALVPVLRVRLGVPQRPLEEVHIPVEGVLVHLRQAVAARSRMARASLYGGEFGAQTSWGVHAKNRHCGAW